mmetsp:Transcript_97352/g.231626  ORF Transcript_97352/g.231626 Transcript_97352/m.231626 type:complete len:239 (-) Transcript_97352:88-804(-)
MSWSCRSICCGERETEEQILLVAGCVRCGQYHCNCQQNVNECVQQGVQQLNFWLSPTDEQLPRNDVQKHFVGKDSTNREGAPVQVLTTPVVYTAYFGTAAEDLAAHDPWVPVPSEDSRLTAAMYRMEPTLEDPLRGPSGDLEAEAAAVTRGLADLQEVKHTSVSPKATRRNVHFEEAKPAERTRDIPWHLLPEPAPPSEKKRVHRRRKSNEDCMSVGSEDSTASSGRMSPPSDGYKRV